MARARAPSSALSVDVTAGEPAPVRAAAIARSARPSFAELVGELSPFVLRVLPRLGVPPSDVEDVSQEVLLVVHRMLPTFEGRSSPRTWVYGICLRVARNHRGRAYVRRERPEALPTLPPALPAAERALDERRLIARLDAALATLPAAQREAFVLHALEELEVSEIASAQDVSKFTVYTRLYAAQRRLRAWFAAHADGERES